MRDTTVSWQNVMHPYRECDLDSDRECDLDSDRDRDFCVKYK